MMLQPAQPIYRKGIICDFGTIRSFVLILSEQSDELDRIGGQTDILADLFTDSFFQLHL